MNRSLRNGRLALFFTLALVAHLALLLAPVMREETVERDENRSLKLRLAPTPISPGAVVDMPATARPVPEETAAPPARILEPPLPPRPPEPEVERITRSSDEPTATPLVLARQYDLQPNTFRSVFGEPTPRSGDDNPDFHFPPVTSLDAVLNEPSLQLPFADRRIYLVDSYDNGVMGDIDRFWDTVTVPFGFTTRNNLEVKCAWVLIIAGCAWDHKSRFYRPAKRREPNGS